MIYIMPIIIGLKLTNHLGKKWCPRYHNELHVHGERERERINIKNLKYYATQVLLSSRRLCFLYELTPNLGLKPQNWFGPWSHLQWINHKTLWVNFFYVKWMRGTLICDSPSLPCINYILFMSSQLEIRDVHVKPSIVDEGTLVTTSPPTRSRIVSFQLDSSNLNSRSLMLILLSSVFK
jgi:hypothetical protein